MAVWFLKFQRWWVCLSRWKSHKSASIPEKKKLKSEGLKEDEKEEEEVEK